MSWQGACFRGNYSTTNCLPAAHSAVCGSLPAARVVKFFSSRHTHSSFLRTDNDDVHLTVGIWPTVFRTRKLDSDGRPHVTSLWSGNVYATGNTRRGRLGNNVKQYFANLACAGSDRVSLFVLERVNQSICVQGKDHWFSVHSQNLPLSPLDSLFAGHESFSDRARDTNQTSSKEKHTRRLRY